MENERAQSAAVRRAGQNCQRVVGLRAGEGQSAGGGKTVAQQEHVVYAVGTQLEQRCSIRMAEEAAVRREALQPTAGADRGIGIQASLVEAIAVWNIECGGARNGGGAIGRNDDTRDEARKKKWINGAAYDVCDNTALDDVALCIGIQASLVEAIAVWNIECGGARNGGGAIGRNDD